MSFETLAVEHDGPIARVWLNRPEARNALSALVLTEIAAAFTELQHAFETRVVILGGRGPSFSAGADRKNPPWALHMTSRSSTPMRAPRPSATSRSSTAT